MKPLLRIAIRRWDRFALLASVAILLSFLTFGVFVASPSGEAGAGQKLAGALGSALNLQPPEPPPGPCVSDRLRSTFGPVIDAAPGSAPLPEIDVKMLLITKPSPLPPPVFQAPILVEAKAEVGRVILSWKDAPGNAFKALGYHIYRQSAGAGEFARITPEPVMGTGHTDTSIEPQATYAYAVSAVTEDAKAAVRESRRSEPRSVVTPAFFRIDFIIDGGSGDSPATVKVHRFAHGRWWDHTYTVRRGDRIGRPERKWHEGRHVEIDFTTRCRVDDIVEVDGPPLGSGEAVIPSKVKALRYTDAEGRQGELIKRR
jgi:hypothetical protein